MASEFGTMVDEETEERESHGAHVDSRNPVVDDYPTRPVQREKEPAWKKNAAFQKRGKPVREVEIYLFPGMHPKDQGKVPVTCHGYRFLINRGEWVKVPVSVRNVLRSAVVTRVVQIGPAPGSLMEGRLASAGYQEIDVPRFNFQWREIGSDD